jgi:hypothetical protein
VIGVIPPDNIAVTPTSSPGTTDPNLPAPSNVSTEIVVGWNTVSRGVAYRIYYGTGQNPSSSGKYDRTTSNVLRLKTLNPGTTYYFQIQAEESNGLVGLISPQVSATTPSGTPPPTPPPHPPPTPPPTPPTPPPPGPPLKILGIVDVLNFSTTDSDDNIRKWMAAVKVQADRDISKYWTYSVNF